MLGTKPGDEGFELENVVYLELLRRGYEVYVGKFDDYEVDFVTIEKGQKKYYQVSRNTVDNDVLQRELRPLKLIKDSYPKYLLTLDNERPSNIDGIVKMNALDFLKES